MDGGPPHPLAVTVVAMKLAAVARRCTAQHPSEGAPDPPQGAVDSADEVSKELLGLSGKSAATSRMARPPPDRDALPLPSLLVPGFRPPARATTRQRGEEGDGLAAAQRGHPRATCGSDAGEDVLLMSLKAGGVGINLTAASNAFVMDPWWNPAVEEQAVMRIHRIGQTKTVSIRRFIVKGTVEERMEAVQARKQRMISGALTDQEVRTARIEELKMLFS
uniref:Helicase C-terminal domain-containing protein n=1 Tax=Zea mays TaxID=4577 RepID=A0A804NRU8_MAIZE